MIFSYLSNLPQLLKIQCWWIWSGRGCRGYPFLAIQKSEVSCLTLQKAHNPGVVWFDLKKSSLWTLQHALKVNNDVQLEVNGFIWSLISNSISQVSMFIFLLLSILKKFHRHFPYLRIPPWNIARNVARFFLRSSASASVRSKPMLICRITTAWRRGNSYPDMTVKFHEF